MAEAKLDPNTLFEQDWKELRTEMYEWDDGEDGVVGFDCLTRYWCPEAVLEVYWIAERGPNGFKVYLTEDLELAGFRSPLSYQPSLGWKRQLANRLEWEARAMAVLNELAGTQMNLFEDK